MCRSRKLPDFPARRDKLEEFFDIQIEPGPNVYWRDEYFGLSTTVIKRTDIATEHASSIPLFPTEKRPAGFDEGLVARSWVRVSHDDDGDENFDLRVSSTDAGAGQYHYRGRFVSTDRGQRTAFTTRRSPSRQGVA